MTQQPKMEDLSPDFVYSSAFTYTFLKDIDTTSTHRPKSIHIPKRDLDVMTGMERQFWEIKMRNFDVIIFFKKGKFYELYDCDAVIGNKEFGLKMTQDLNNRGKMRMSGVPEQSFVEWSRLFVFQGYKVGKVEQLVVDEKMLAANGGKEPKCIPRELTVILTRGTLTENNAISGPEPVCVVAIVPHQRQQASGGDAAPSSPSGPCFSFDAVAVDLSRQSYYYCPAENTTELVTLLHHLCPKEVLVVQQQQSSATTQQSSVNSGSMILSSMVADLLPDCQIEQIDMRQCAAFHTALANSSSSSSSSSSGGNSVIPPPSWYLVSEYFKYLKIDSNLLLPAKFILDNRRSKRPSDDPDNNGDDDGDYSERFEEPHFRLYSLHKKTDLLRDAASGVSGSALKGEKILEIERRCDRGMALDSAAIESLDLVVNSRDGTSNATMIAWLLADRSGLPVAARMLRQWLLRPSSNSDVINARQRTVQLIHDPPATLRSLVTAWNALFDRVQNSCGGGGGVSQQQAAAANNNNNADAEGGGDGGGGDGDGEADDAPASPARRLSARKSALLQDSMSLTSIDFERLLSRISDFKSEDTRVAFAEPLVHYPKNLQNIHTLLKGFEQLLEFYKNADRALSAFVAPENNNHLGADELQGKKHSIKLLRELVDAIGTARGPIAALLKQFPRNKIREDDFLLLPDPGQNAEYDKAEAEIQGSERTLKNKLTEFRNKLKDNSVAYCDIGKDLFLLEIPTKLSSAGALKNAGIPSTELKERARTNKNVKFEVASLQSTITTYKKATVGRELAIIATLRGVATNICKSWPQLFSASRAAGYLDCLFTLANVARQQSCRGSVYFPTFVSSSCTTDQQQQQTSVDLKGAYHPLLLLLGNKCVPNDIALGNAESNTNERCLVLSGPNMAGKSTLMRTVAINVILAQIGCAACASYMQVTGAPVDRVFTRIGAKDATHLGQSTLFVELSETASIIKEATGRSLCLLDELGRGTSTHDGYAIAHACLRELAAIETQRNDDDDGGRQKQPSPQSEEGNDDAPVDALMNKRVQTRVAEHRIPLVMFATHYHALALEVSLLEGEARQRVQLGYMDFASSSSTSATVATAAAAPSADGQHHQHQVRSDVRFLYKLVPGICARSYGAEVALQAGLPRNLVEDARRVSKQMALVSADHQLAEFRNFMMSCEKQRAALQQQGGVADGGAEEAALLEKVRNRARQLIAMASAATAVVD